MIGPVATVLAAIMWLVPVFAHALEPPDAAAIRKKMEKIIKFVDSPGYAQWMSWDEHVVLAYKLAQGRLPSPLEFYVLDALREDIGFTRSAALSAALRGEALTPTWDMCRDFVRRVEVADFRAGQQVKESARQLAGVPRWQILAEMHEQILGTIGTGTLIEPAPLEQAEADIQYKAYFGYLHAHCELSDGEGSALEAYTYAHDEGGLDFFALTDHGELLAVWPWERKWDVLVDAAEATYQPGTYATLWGFEWSNPILGHINVVNTADYTHTLATFRIASLYDWIAERPEGFGRFNHPGDYDYLGIEFLHLKPYPEAVRQMVGIETWNTNKSFDLYYYNGSWDSNYSYWDVGNLKGWYLGALGGQDNHHRNWGTLNDFRVAVLAEALTREAIVNGYLSRRFYATEDKDLYLDLRCQGYPMGARLSGVPRDFEVEACDGSGDIFQEVRLYRNGDLFETQAVSGNCIQASFSDTSAWGAAYYYVIVQQDDDNDDNGRNDEAISSPIWID